MKKLMLAVMFGLAALPAAAPAQGHPAGAYLVVIPVHDLDLSTPSGASALRIRAGKAASDICLEDVRPLRSRHAVELCRNEFMGKVEQRIQVASRQSRTMAGR